MKLLIAILITIFLIGCNQKSPTPKNYSLPNWYLNPPKCNNNCVYVSGSGLDKKEAIFNALSNFIARYNVTISSEIETKKEEFGGIYSKEKKESIKVIINPINLSGYQIVKGYQYNFDKFLVLLKIDKNILFKNLKKRVDIQFKEYKNQYKMALKKNPIKVYLNLKKLLSTLQKEKNTLYFLKALNQKFDLSSYFTFIQEVKNKYAISKQKLTIKINSNNSIFTEDIKKYLTQNEISIDKSNLILNVKVTQKIDNSYMNLKVYYIYLNLFYKNKLIGTNFFKVVIPYNLKPNGYLFEEIKNIPLKNFFNLN